MNPYHPYKHLKPDDSKDRLWTDGVRYFVMIPKNASSTIIDALKILGWTCQYNLPKRLHKPTPTEGIFFGVVRDPVQRWISGAVQTFHQINDIQRRLFEDIGPFIDDPWYDQHQSPQAWYYRDIENPRLYKMESIPQMVGWLNSQGISLDLIDKNVAKRLRTRRILYERIIEQMTPEYEAKLREFYREDQSLYDGAL